MQSHASRHVVSEFLKDLHPDLSPPFPKEIIKDEIAEAYNRRAVPKLIDVLALPQTELSDDDRAHALRVFNGLLSTQEHKTNAVNSGAAVPLTQLVRDSADWEVRRLSCEALGSLAQIRPGRIAVKEAGGLVALTDALQTTPEASAGALRQFSVSNDGVALLAEMHAFMVPAIVAMINGSSGGEGEEQHEGGSREDGVSIKACENAASTLAGIATTDGGVVACLGSHVPRCIVALANRGLTGDFKFEMNLNDLLAECASCLEQICHHPYGKTAVREAEGIPVLASLVALTHRLTVKKAVSALMAISIEKESKVPVIVYAGTTLVKLLRGADEELAANARSALKNTCEHLEARKTLGMLMDPKEQQSLLYQAPLPPTPPDFRYQIKLPYEDGVVL